MTKVSPTRINLLRLKGELKVAKKGHKLLKDKRDGLMKEFMAVVRDVQDLRREVNAEFVTGLEAYISASALMSPRIIENASMPGKDAGGIDVAVRQVMSVTIPRFTVPEETSDAFALGYLESYGNMDVATRKLSKTYPKLVKLAELESAVERLALEIERTRRRASALEHIRIPYLEKTIREIYLRLEEQARDAVVSVMRVKALITQ